MNFENFRVYLRAIESDDYKTTIKWHNDNEIWNMVGGTKYFVSMEYEKKWIEDAIWNKDQIKLGICVKENNELIGFCSLIKMDLANGSAEISIMIGDNQYWGKGLGSEAILLLSDFAFSERGFNRIWALILENNIASRRMFEKCGYKTEGVLRKSIYKNSKFHNQVIMSILQEDFYQMLKEKGTD